MDSDRLTFLERETGKKLNSVQAEAVLHSEHPLLLLASPGSGKTTTLIFRIAYLILECKVDPSTLLCVTFSKASAKDMEDRFQSLFGSMISQPVHFSTIHSLSFQIVRQHFRNQSLNYTVIEGDMEDEEKSGGVTSGQVNKKTILRRLYYQVNHNPITEDVMMELLKDISYVKNKLLSVTQLREVKSNVENFAQIYEQYEEWKRKDPNVLLVDFDDMLTLSYEILQKDQTLCAKYQNQFQYVLSDESQDTSYVQHRIIEKLAEPQNNLCIVADDDQTLYTWRGAEIGELLMFHARYPDGRILTMEQNYRSSQEIVEISNRFIKRNKKRYEKNMFTENGSVKLPIIQTMDSYANQLTYIVEALKETETLSESAVLYRNNLSSINVINALDMAGIPFYIKDSDNKFFRHWVLSDVLNFMRLSFNNRKDVIFEQIYSKMVNYLSKAHIQWLKTQDTSLSVFERLIEYPSMPDYQKEKLQKHQELFLAMNKMRPKDAIRLIRTDLEYDKVLRKLSEKFGYKMQSMVEILDILENLAETLETLESFAFRLRALEDLMKKSKFNKHKNVVTLSTFHSAKGLEFDKVYMIDLINGVIPSEENLSDYREGKTEEMEESARLFYVGMTRAKTHLELLTYRKKGDERVSESMFISDVKRIMYPHYGKNVQVKESVEELIPVQVDMRVTHKKFGSGKVKHIDGDVIRICFDDGRTKHLSLSACSEHQLLKVVS